MRTWPKRVGSLAALTIGLIACFAPGDDDVVDLAASRLPADAPLFLALSEPDLLLDEASRLFGLEGLSPDAWTQAGLDPTGPLTVARWPGEAPLWVISCAVADDSVAAEGLDELLDSLTTAHRVVLDGARVHALVALTAVEQEVFRAAARALEEPTDGESLAGSTRLEPLGADGLMLYLQTDATIDLLGLPSWSRLVLMGLNTCTLRASPTAGGWGASLQCPTEGEVALHHLLTDTSGALAPAGQELEAGLQLSLSPQVVAQLWGQWADEDTNADRAHTAWLDLAERAGLSPSKVWSHALSGQVTLSVNRWPSATRRPGLMARVGVEDQEMVARLIQAANEHLDELPGVRLEREVIRGVDGWRAEWLRHRGHDLSWAQSDGVLWVAYGAADLDDALSEVDEPQWRVDDGPAAAWVGVGEVMDLSSVLGALTLDVTLAEEEVGLTGHLLRPESATAQRTISQLLTWGEEYRERQRRARLIEQLTGVCDAIDLHAVDHGLPVSLDAVADVVDVRDPWGRAFDYARPATRRRHQRYDLCSAGPDGLPRTSDDICYE